MTAGIMHPREAKTLPARGDVFPAGANVGSRGLVPNALRLSLQRSFESRNWTAKPLQVLISSKHSVSCQLEEVSA